MPTYRLFSRTGCVLCGSTMPSGNDDKDSISENHYFFTSCSPFSLLFVNLKVLHLNLLRFQVVVMFLLSSVGFFVLSYCLYRHQVILPSYNPFKMSAVCLTILRPFVSMFQIIFSELSSFSEVLLLCASPHFLSRISFHLRLTRNICLTQ